MCVVIVVTRVVKANMCSQIDNAEARWWQVCLKGEWKQYFVKVVDKSMHLYSGKSDASPLRSIPLEV